MIQAMSTTMDNPACEWVRGRLPLWTGFGDGADDPSDDGGDLGVEDRRSIGRHLKGCAECRAHRSALSRSMEALAVASGSLPIAPDAPSLWASLERRIAAQHSHHRSEERPAQEPTAGRDLALASLDGERPLQSAWMQDTLRELLAAAGLGALGDRSGSAGRGPSMRSPRTATGRWRIAGASLAASVLALLVVLPASWRQRAGAEARIRENAAPVAAMVELPAESQPEAPSLVESDSDDDRDLAAGQLAQAEPVHPPAEPTPPADATAGAKPSAPTRFDYDLEHGTSTSPEGRDVKPVY
jgi:hypothetical protein